MWQEYYATEIARMQWPRWRMEIMLQYNCEVCGYTVGWIAIGAMLQMHSDGLCLRLPLCRSSKGIGMRMRRRIGIWISRCSNGRGPVETVCKCLQE